MALASHDIGCCRDSSSMKLLSPFSALCRLQHTCGMRCHPLVDHFRRHSAMRQEAKLLDRKRPRVGGQALNAGHCTRHASTSCRAQALVADPAVTGQPQKEATPNDGSTQTVSQSSAYPFEELEAKWQSYWLQNKTFRTPDIKELDTSKPKFYALDMFPYPRSVVSSPQVRSISGFALDH